MPFKVNGKVLPELAHLRVRELVEAEKALGVSAGDSDGAGMAVSLYVLLRREDPEISAGLLADQVLDVDFSEVETVEEEAHPTSPEDPALGQLESLPTSGRPPLEASG